MISNDTNVSSHSKQDSITPLAFYDLTTQLVKKFKRKLRRYLIYPSIDIRIKEKTTKVCSVLSNVLISQEKPT